MKYGQNSTHSKKYGLVKMFVARGLTDIEIAKKTGISRQQVCGIRRKLHLKSNITRRLIDWTPFDYLFKTHSNVEISKIVDCSLSAVSNRRARLSIMDMLPLGDTEHIRNDKTVKYNDELQKAFAEVGLDTPAKKKEFFQWAGATEYRSQVSAFRALQRSGVQWA